MAGKQETSSVNLKLLIDEKTNRVVCAEAEKEFVDILISFLTFSMGTIIRLTSSKNPVSIGCMNNLYHSLQNLRAENWYTKHCRTKVINTRNPLADYCKMLKMNVDNSGSEKNYWCSRQGCSYFSTYENVRCCCGKGTTTELYNDSDQSVTNCKYEGTFLREGSIMFLIRDDLQIRPGSPKVLAQLLSDLGISEMNPIREIPLQVSKEKVMCLLARSLVSKSPLSDVFMPKHGAKPERTLSSSSSSSSSIGVIQTPDQNAPTLNLKVIVKMHTNKILYAEATDGFFDFLCSFLTISIGTMMRLLKGNSGLGCIDNLYTSVEELDEKWFGSGIKSYILDPGVAPHHNCKNQPLNLLEREGGNYLINPRRSNRFSVKPSVFMVLGNLEVKPLSFSSSLLIVRELKVPSSDTEEQLVAVGMKEALSLLKAALTSPSSALTDGLSSFLQKQHMQKA